MYNTLMKIIYLRSKISSDPRPFASQQKEYIPVLEKSREFQAFVGELPVIFIESGGTEEEFKEIYLSLPEPHILVATGANNSLPASLEICSFLTQQNHRFVLLHGTPLEVVEMAKEAHKKQEANKILKETKILNGMRFGVVGKPSNWLISSITDYKALKEKLGVELVDVSFECFRKEIDEAKDVVDPVVFEPKLNEKVSLETLKCALKIYSALRNIIQKNNLNGVTVRCFDLLGTLHNTSCLALAMLNKDGYIATCEGDVPTMLTMALVRQLTHQSAFQVNPSYINVKNRYAIFAHCTLPLDMCLSYRFDTHFESGIGLGIAGRLNLGKVTVLKVNKDWSKFQAFDAKITANLGRNDLCRTQVKVEFDEDISSLLDEPLGNHIVICYGAHKKEIEDLLK